jgi:lysosomal acid lipase/cholesteryl ester hydrolase
MRRVRGAFVTLAVSATALLFALLAAPEAAPELCTVVAARLGEGADCAEAQVATADGHVLRVYRVRRAARAAPASSAPVLLVHGLMDRAATFVVSGNASLVSALLADEPAREVWLCDLRGREPYAHAEGSDAASYWSFSLDEQVSLDLPAVVQHVQERSGGRGVHLVAHSQGGVVGALMLASQRGAARAVRSLTVLGSPLGAWRGAFFVPLPPDLLERVLHPGKVAAAARAVAGAACSVLPALCARALCLAAGCQAAENFSPDTIRWAFRSYPAAASLRNVQHLVQADLSGGWRRFDHGREENTRRYGSPTAPAYDLADLATPVALFYGSEDRFLARTAMEDARAALPRSAVKVADGSLPFGHGCLVWGDTAPALLHPKILAFLATTERDSIANADDAAQ